MYGDRKLFQYLLNESYKVEMVMVDSVKIDLSKILVILINQKPILIT